MVDGEDAPAPDPATCWTCGRAADPASALTVTLESLRTPRDSLGHAVTLTGGTPSIDIAIPRCRSCRTWAGWEIAAIGACIGGGIFTPGLTLVAYSRLTGTPMPTEADASFATGPFLVFLATILISGAAYYFAITALATRVVGQRPLRGRSKKTYPPVVALRQLGWTWPATGD